MNTCGLTGTVIEAPGPMEKRQCGQVWHFRIRIDVKPGKRATEVTVAAWDSLGRFLAQYFAVGDRVKVCGHLTHASGRGVLVSADQLEKIEPSHDVSVQGELDNSDLEQNWHKHLDLGRRQGGRR